MPYNTRHRKPINQNNRGQKPNIPPQQRSLSTSCTVTTTDIMTKLQGNRDMSMHMIFRHVSSLTPAL